MALRPSLTAGLPFSQRPLKDAPGLLFHVTTSAHKRRRFVQNRTTTSSVRPRLLVQGLSCDKEAAPLPLFTEMPLRSLLGNPYSPDPMLRVPPGTGGIT